MCNSIRICTRNTSLNVTFTSLIEIMHLVLNETPLLCTYVLEISTEDLYEWYTEPPGALSPTSFIFLLLFFFRVKQNYRFLVVTPILLSGLSYNNNSTIKQSDGRYTYRNMTCTAYTFILWIFYLVFFFCVCFSEFVRPPRVSINLIRFSRGENVLFSTQILRGTSLENKKQIITDGVYDKLLHLSQIIFPMNNATGRACRNFQPKRLFSYFIFPPAKKKKEEKKAIWSNAEYMLPSPVPSQTQTLTNRRAATISTSYAFREYHTTKNTIRDDIENKYRNR